MEEAARLNLRAIALTDHDGLYGVVRFAEAARELDVATVFGAELSLSNVARTEDPDPPGPHLLVLARGPEGYRRLSREIAKAHLAGGEKGRPRYDFDQLTEAAGGHWHILTGCRKGHVRQALSDGGPDAAAAALADLVDRFGRTGSASNSPTTGIPATTNATPRWPSWRPFRSGGGGHHRGALRDTVAGRLAMAMAAIRARNSIDTAAGWLAPLGGVHLRWGRRWRACSIPSSSPRQLISVSSARSGSRSSHRSCRRSTCPTGTPRTAGCVIWRWRVRHGGTARRNVRPRRTRRSSTS